MAFVADDLAAWLIGLLADAALKRLIVFVRGTPQERALQGAAAAAIERTALEFVPAGGEEAENLARVVDQVFGAAPRPAVAAGQVSVLEAVQAGVAGRLAVLGDAAITETGRSSADVLGVDLTRLTEALTRHLVQEIIYQGAVGGALTPLAGQLNHDVTHLQARELKGLVAQLLVMVQDTLRRLDEAQQATIQAASSGPLDPVFSHYFEPLARGVQRASVAGWYFTGRETALREIVTWLAATGYGALIVTGEPGSGKSAVLARIVTMADAVYRATVPAAVTAAAPPGTLPPEGSVDVAIRASGMTAFSIAQAITLKLGLVATGTEETIDQVLSRGVMTTVVIDAVDEADDPEELWTELIAPLAQYARTGGIRLLLGARPKSIRKLQGSRTLNLDSPDYFKDADIAGYVASYLRGHDRSRFGDLSQDPAAAARLGWRIARNAGFSFLIAHLTAMSLVEGQDDNPGTFPSTVGEALEQSLNRIAKALRKLGPGDRERTVPGWRLWVRELLTPLAYTEGEGPGDDLWAGLATMMGTDTYSVQDVRVLRDKSPAGDLLQGSAAATRLFHTALAEHLREDASRPDPDREISESLISRIARTEAGALDWDAAPAYARHYLASHAGRAGVLDPLMLDVGYLLAADPGRLLAQLPSLTSQKARQVAHVYELTAHRLRGVNRRSAASALGLTALLSEVNWFAEAIAAVVTMTTEPLWAHWQPVSPHRQLVGHQAPVRSVAVCEVGDSLLVVSGADDGKVLAWDYATTLETQVGDDTLPGPVTAIVMTRDTLVAGFQVDVATRFRDLRTRAAVGGDHALRASAGLVAGRPAVATGDNVIELRSLDTGGQVGGPFQHSEAPVTALGFGRTRSADLLLAACTEAKVHLWEIASQAVAGVLAAYQDPVTATAVHEVGGYLTVVAVHSNRTIQSWDVATGRPVGRPLVGHTGRVLAVTAGEFHGRPYVVTGGEDGTVRVWETGDPAGDGAAEPQEGMLAVAVGQRDGAAVVVTAGQTRVLQTWNLATGEAASPPVAIAGGVPAALALGRFGGNDGVAGLADEAGRIYLWDLATAQRVPQRGTADGWSSALTVGILDGRLVSATGGVEPRRTVIVYDLRTGDQVGAAIALSAAATAAFIGQLGDRRLLATADRSNAVAVWDLDTGRAYGRPVPLSGASISVVALGALDTGPVVATAGPAAPVEIWHLTRDEQSTLDLGSTVTGLAFGDDETMIVTADAGIACVRICGQDSRERNDG